MVEGIPLGVDNVLMSVVQVRTDLSGLGERDYGVTPQRIRSYRPGPVVEVLEQVPVDRQEVVLVVGLGDLDCAVLDLALPVGGEPIFDFGEVVTVAKIEFVRQDVRSRDERQDLAAVVAVVGGVAIQIGV